jgi:hypothetical protein
LPGADDERSAAGEIPFAALDGVLQQLRRTQIPVGDIQVAEPQLLQAMAAGPDARVDNMLVFSRQGTFSFRIWLRPYRRIVS